MTTAHTLFESIHGKNCEFLGKSAIIDFAEVFARTFYSQKLLESQQINDTFFYEEKRGKFPKEPPIKDLP